MESSLIKPNKNLGQNFLKDPNILSKIVSCAHNLQNRTVIEIGPGPCGLTEAILKANPLKLISIEADARFTPLLENLENTHANFAFIIADAMKVNLRDVSNGNFTIIANLPYNVGTRLLVNWLSDIIAIDQMILMLQKEVVMRICAQPKSSDYGRLSILCQSVANVNRVFDVKPGAFFPAPKVCSSVLSLTPKSEQIAPKLLDKIKHITALAFNQRRKMLKSSLSSLSSNLSKDLESLNIKATDRAEDLTVEDYMRLAQYFM
jgi:16S rRNA (adenine1518-N6/adenine1519-N6)-dimethyltransferase